MNKLSLLDASPEPFKLTLPKGVEAWLRSFLKNRNDGLNIVEYGTGGSSFLFTENPKNLLVAGETDKGWLSRLISELKQIKRFNFIPAYMNIGPTKEWGLPHDANMHSHLYPSAVKHPTNMCRNAMVTPDFFFIDGRFRVASFCEAYILAPKSTPIMIDDYFDRPEYHVVEQLVPVYSRIGRAALFIKPSGPVNKGELHKLTSYYLNPD